MSQVFTGIHRSYSVLRVNEAFAAPAEVKLCEIDEQCGRNVSLTGCAELRPCQAPTLDSCRRPVGHALVLVELRRIGVNCAVYDGKVRADEST